VTHSQILSGTGSKLNVAPEALTSEIKLLIAKGQREAAANKFGELVTLNQARAARIAYSYLREPTEAEEAVQDAFLKAFLKLPSFREDSHFEAWFATILVNTCFDRLKARKRRDRLVIPMESRNHPFQEPIANQSKSPEEALLSTERSQWLQTAIEKLPHRQRTAVVLSQLQGFSTGEVGAIMGLKESTVRVHLFRALRKLRVLLVRTTLLNPRNEGSVTPEDVKSQSSSELAFTAGTGNTQT